MLALVKNSTNSGAKLVGIPPDCPFSYDALMSLHSQLIVRTLKSDSKFIERSIDKIINQVRKGQSLFEIANERRFSSYKIAKTYVEKVHGQKLQLPAVIENPLLIEDAIRRADILKCIAHDSSCSHEVTQLQECCGREYEEMLIEYLQRLGACFETEADLRAKGKPKTPDILFSIPMATKTAYSKDAYFVVNWIDSKAIFADEVTLSEHMGQFEAYTNRYGRGLVIYWHGFKESVLGMSGDSVAITDSFPPEWIYPTGEMAQEGVVPSFDKPRARGRVKETTPDDLASEES